ncbi:MAG: hypothetical protein JWL63_2423 [Rhodocyclales bacterium]|nr:hypothetical protein [Rhodocyclales bacterium]
MGGDFTAARASRTGVVTGRLCSLESSMATFAFVMTTVFSGLQARVHECFHRVPTEGSRPVATRRVRHCTLRFVAGRIAAAIGLAVPLWHPCAHS